MKDKVVMVTGATGSLGEATSRAFAEAGAQVVMLSRNAAKLEASVRRVRAAAPDATGRFFTQEKEIRSNADSNLAETQQRLWSISAELIGIQE